MNRPLRKITSHYVLTPQGLLPKAILSFTPDGTLVDISVTDRVDAQEGVEFFSGLLIPGMVNAHCHLELSYLRGRIPHGCGFAGFADGITAVCGEATERERVEAISYWDAKMYKDGITAVGDVCNGTTTFTIKKSSPVYYHSFVELFGLRSMDSSPVQPLIQAAFELGIPFSPTPHSTYSLQDTSFREVAALGNPLSVHFMESPGETQLFRQEGTLWERNRRDGIDIDFLKYGSPAGRIISSVPPGKNILLIHNVFVSKEDVERIENHFTGKITWVLCPRSNQYIEKATPPMRLFREMNVRVAVGTDSLASNDSLSMIEELKLLRDIPLEDRLRWATIHGAEALGIDNWAGSFGIGKRPGAVLISGVDWERMELTPQAISHRII